MATIRFNEGWPRKEVRRPPTIDEVMVYYRFYRMEEVYPDGWTCHYKETRYSPPHGDHGGRVAIFIYPANKFNGERFLA